MYVLVCAVEREREREREMVDAGLYFRFFGNCKALNYVVEVVLLDRLFRVLTFCC